MVMIIDFTLLLANKIFTLVDFFFLYGEDELLFFIEFPEILLMAVKSEKAHDH